MRAVSTGQITFSRPVGAVLRLVESAIATGILCVFAATATQGTFSTPIATPTLQTTPPIVMVQRP